MPSDRQDNNETDSVNKNVDSSVDKNAPNKVKDNGKPIVPIQRRLKMTWLCWIAYRLVILPILVGVFHHLHPDIIGGMAWQLLWLIPALILTPWMLKATSAYALLMGSILTLIYFGASGVTVFTRFYDSGVSVIWVYIIDFLLIAAVNYYLFVLLKRLPSMNGVVKDKH